MRFLLSREPQNVLHCSITHAAAFQPWKAGPCRQLLVVPLGSPRCITAQSGSDATAWSGRRWCAGPAEDVRTYKFASFDAREDLIPSDAQLKAAEDVMAAVDLTQGAVSTPVCKAVTQPACTCVFQHYTLVL